MTGPNTGILIAVVGLAGAGKSTAVDHFESLGAGRKVYVGELVLNEVRARSLQVTPANEKLVRLDLRRTNGPDAFAALAAPEVLRILRSGANVLLDAIFNIEEYRHFRQLCSDPVFLIAITASLDVRAERLRQRGFRTLSRDELKARDETELTQLRIDRVLAEAHYSVVNEGTLEAYKGELGRVWESLSASSPRPMSN